MSKLYIENRTSNSYIVPCDLPGMMRKLKKTIKNTGSHLNTPLLSLNRIILILETPQSITSSVKKLSENNMPTVSKTLDEIKTELRDKPLADLPEDSDIDLSDIAEATPEEFDRGKALTQQNVILCRILIALIDHKQLTPEEVARYTRLSPDTINLIRKSGCYPGRLTRLMLAITALTANPALRRRIEIPPPVQKDINRLINAA